jgi:fatty-acyl-CoA synthase
MPPSITADHRAEPLRRRVTSASDVLDIEGMAPQCLLPGATIQSCLAASAALDPDKPAIVLVEPPDFRTPARIVGYRELVQDVMRSAGLFSTIDEASVAAVMLPMVPEGLTALWGAATSGVGLPLNPFLELASVIRILCEARATVLVTTRSVVEGNGASADDLITAVPTLRRVFYVGDHDERHDFTTALLAGPPQRAFDPDPDHCTMLMPTGGTTGTPKIVRMTQRGQLTVAWNVGALMGLERNGVVGHGMPNFHCGGTISLGLRAMLFGQTLLTLTSAGFRSREAVESFWDIARQYRMTSILATPTTARAILDAGGTADGTCLTDFHVGGSQLPVELANAFRRRFGIWLRENWGMTEIHGTVTGHYNDGSRPRVGSAGRALPHFRVRAVELDASGRYVRDCSPGEQGALLIGAPSVMDGYLDPAQDIEFFPTGLSSPAGDVRWGNTGDVGCVDEDGYVWISGRVKDLIIRGGHNIDPRQIEESLTRHPSVGMAAAVGRPCASKGELPMAYVQLKPGTTAWPEDLIAFSRAHIQERAAVPVEIVVVDALPLTPVGKVSKPALRTDALRREIRALLATLSSTPVDPVIRVDRSGRRQHVVVTLDKADAHIAGALAERLAAYEFLSEVEVEGE